MKQTDWLILNLLGPTKRLDSETVLDTQVLKPRIVFECDFNLMVVTVKSCILIYKIDSSDNGNEF